MSGNRGKPRSTATAGTRGLTVLVSNDRPERARNAKTEATYERMSAGSTAPEAGQIARNLAHDIRDADAVDAAKEAQGAR